jgi:hypothetical protein
MSLIPEEETENSDEAIEADDAPDYIDFGNIGKGLFLLGIISLLVIISLTFMAMVSSSSDTWEGVFFWSRDLSPSVVVIPVLLMLFGGFFYFIHMQFLKLAQVDEELNSENL